MRREQQDEQQQHCPNGNAEKCKHAEVAECEQSVGRGDRQAHKRGAQHNQRKKLRGGMRDRRSCPDAEYPLAKDKEQSCPCRYKEEVRKKRRPERSDQLRSAAGSHSPAEVREQKAQRRACEAGDGVGKLHAEQLRRRSGGPDGHRQEHAIHLAEDDSAQRLQPGEESIVEEDLKRGAVE